MDRGIEATMKQQAALGPAVDTIYEAVRREGDGSGFTSLAFEGPGLSLYWSGGVPAGVMTAVEAARSVGPVRIRPARHSLAALEAAAARLEKAAAGSDLQSITTRYDGEGLDVERMPAQVAARAAARAPLKATDTVVGAAGVPTRVSTASHGIERLASRLDDSSPWNGGTRILNPDSPLGTRSCTSGFGVLNSAGQRYVLTAGHCSRVGNNYYDNTWEHIGQACSEDWDKDLTIICAPGYHRMFDGPPGTSTYKNVKGWGYHVVNELVCHSGATSGTICALQTQSGSHTNYGCDSDNDCFYMHGLVKAVQLEGREAGQPGDSGAPVFTIVPDGVRAKGIVSARSGTTLLFQDWADVIRIWNLYPVTI